MRRKLEAAVAELINAQGEEEREFRRYKYDLLLNDMSDQGQRKEQKQIRDWIKLSEQVGELPQGGLPSEELQRWQGQKIGELIEQLDHQPEIQGLGAQRAEEFPEFFDKLIELIGLIGSGYLSVYEHIVGTYSDFFKEFNNKITAKLKDWMEAGDEGKEITLDVKELRDALKELIDEFGKKVLFPVPAKEGDPPSTATPEEKEKAARNWLKALGLPDECLKYDADGNPYITLDVGPLQEMYDAFGKAPDPIPDSVTWDSARFQAWQTGFNAQSEQLKNELQRLTQKYSSANSTHDNFIKVLSSHLSQFSDMLKFMTNF